VIFVLVPIFIIIRVLFLSTIFPFCCPCSGSRSQVITLREATVMVAEDNILYGL
jgi:hypothetical protein